MHYSIVIPAYNEASRIGVSLEKLDAYFSKLRKTYEIIVVDDGSTDSTYQVLLDYKKRIANMQIQKHDINHGKGTAIESGVALAKSDRIIFCDADLSTPARDIHKLLKTLDEYDIAIASRYVKGADANIPLFRIVISRVFNYLTRILFLHDIKDTQCGFKAFRKPVKMIISGIISHHYVFDLDFLMRARAKGFTVKEVPVNWVYEAGTSLNALTPLKMFMQILRLRLYRLFKKD